MKLNEAIRLGAMMKPQAFGELRGRRLKTGWRGWFLREREAVTCAWGAALDAHHLPTKMVPRSERLSQLRGAISEPEGAMVEVSCVPDEWSVLYMPVVCPACSGFPESVFNLIAHLNDTHYWTRERIADWVETLESPQSADAVREDVDQSLVPLRAK